MTTVTVSETISDRWLKTRDSVEFELWGWFRGISDELKKNLGDLAALGNGSAGRDDYDILWYLHCEAALSSEGPSFSSIPAIRAAMVRYKDRLDAGRFAEFGGEAVTAPSQGRLSPIGIAVENVHPVDEVSLPASIYG